MTEEESNLFQVRFNDEGKKFIRKFALISHVMLVLVIFETAVSIYWNIRMLLRQQSEEGLYGLTAAIYVRIQPYIFIVFSLLGLISNLYYLRFPPKLLRCIEINDEFGANRAFGQLYKGALIFLVWLVLINANLVWTLIGMLSN